MSYWILLFLIGLALGSFLNVVTLRYVPEDSVFNFKNIRGRSRCPHCYKALRWFELIPVFSFLLQKGKCRSCLMKLTPQYLIVELLSALALVLIPHHFDLFVNLKTAELLGQSLTGYYLEVIIFILAFLTFIVIGVIDYRYRIIPDELNVFMVFLGIALIITTLYFPTNFNEKTGVGFYASIFNWQESIWLNRFIGILAGAIITGLPVFLSGGRVMGLGDFKLALALGFLFGWPNIVFILFGAFIIGSIVGLALIAFGKKRFQSFIPFAPFISGGALVIFLWGEVLLKTYFNLFRI